MQAALENTRKNGNAIQYYMLKSLDSLSSILNIKRDIDVWNKAHGVLHSVSYNYLSNIYGSAKADEVYVKEWSNTAEEIYEDFGWLMAA